MELPAGMFFERAGLKYDFQSDRSSLTHGSKTFTGTRRLDLFSLSIIVGFDDAQHTVVHK